MRQEDHSNRIYYKNLSKIIKKYKIDLNDKVLVICGGSFDDQVLHQLGFKDVLVTSLGDQLVSNFNYKSCDAQNLPFKDEEYDYVFVHAGLHHCDSPHKALLEMYRVAKKGIFVCEAQDNVFTRLLLKLSLIEDYEFSSI